MKVLLFNLIILMAACTGDKDKSSASEQRSTTETPTEDISFFVGTYTQAEEHVDGSANGIYRVLFNPENGEMQRVGVTSGIINPSYLAISPDNRHLYAVSEIGGKDGPSGFLVVYAIDADMNLNEIQRVETGGPYPCHLNIDSKGQFVFVVNYVGGYIKTFGRQGTGRLVETDVQRIFGGGDHPQQDDAHAHAVVLSPDENYVYVPDKGSDKVWAYHLDRKGKRLMPTDQIYVKLADLAGPRHMVFHPAGSYAYVVNELNNTITLLSYNQESGELADIQTESCLPHGFNGTSWSSAIRIHPNGLHLYAANRGHNSIARFSVDDETGAFELKGFTETRGDYPRDFNIDPSGNFLLAANQNSDNIVVFRIDRESGSLRRAKEMAIETPVAIAFKH